MNEQAVFALICVPGAVSLGWLLWRVLVAQWLELRAARESWPALAAALGFAPEAAQERPRTNLAGAMRGTFRGRSVLVEAGMFRGQGRDSPAELFTSWETKASLGIAVQDRKLLDKMLPASGPQTGDEAFDRAFRVEGAAAALDDLLTPAARAAVQSYQQALGGIQLGEEGLRHTTYAIVADPHRLQSIVDWQAWLLDAMGAGSATPPPPAPRASAARGGSLRSAALVLAGIAISCAGALAYRAHLDGNAGSEAQRFAPQVGDRLLGNFQGKGRWYAGVVVERGDARSAGDALVVYQDGLSERLGLDALAPDRLGAEARVEAPREGGTSPASVLQRKGDAVEVRFDDGQTAWLAVSQVALTVVDTRPGEQLSLADRVLAPWRGDPEHLYVGVVIERNADWAQVLFLDGASERRRPDELREAIPEPGSEVQVLRGEVWVPATVRSRIDHALLVESPGQEPTWTALAAVRVPR